MTSDRKVNVSNEQTSHTSETTRVSGDDPTILKRDMFLIPEGMIYMDGNSLGPSSVASKQAVECALSEQWEVDLITSWNTHAWIDLPQLVGSKIAPIIGANEKLVIACDSISVNLFKLLSAALKINSNRKVILSEQKNFPTDLYIAQGLESLLGTTECELRLAEKDQIENALNDDIAVLMLTHVDFRTGEMLNMERVTKLAHDNGILVIWDLAHSAGAVPLELDRWNVDFAVGCGYKYLNGGPGSPAFIYVAQRHLSSIKHPLTGWMGHSSPFDFNSQYNPSDGIERMLCGTPPILSFAALNGALTAFENVDMTKLRMQSNSLKDQFLKIVSESLSTSADLTLITPIASERQGSQLSFTHPKSYAISQALIAKNVIVDFRAPNIVRFGFTPLYLSHAEVILAANTFCDIITSKQYLDPNYQIRNKVT